ncbi:MAG: helix-turn-helix transcriptional regulator [Trueperaceae bacterium]
MESAHNGLGSVVRSQGRRLDWIALSLDPPVSQSTVTRWCSGERAIPPLRVKQLAELLGVSEREITSTPTAAKAGA